MIQGLYSVYDRIAEESGPIFDAKSDSVAIRKVSGLFIDRPVMDVRDYMLLKHGEFDTEKGVITSFGDPLTVDFLVSYNQLKEEVSNE